MIDFSGVFDAAPVPLLIFDARDYRICDANEAFFDAVGAAPGEVVGRTFDEAFPVNPDDPLSFENVRELRGALDEVKSSGKPSAVPLQRYSIPVRDGEEGRFEERYWSVADSPLFDETGELRYIVHRIEDITELVQAHRNDGGENEAERVMNARASAKAHKVLRFANRLRKVNEHLRIAQRVANVGSWRLSARSGRHDWSDEMYRITGFPRHRPITSRTVLGLVHPDDRRYFIEERRRFMQGQDKPGEFEHRIVRANDGRVRYVRERVEISRDGSGEPAWLFGTLQDITEYRKAEAQVRESDERFRMVAKATADTIWDWNPRTNRVWWNEGIRTVFGYDADNRESPAERFNALVHPEDRERVNTLVRNALSDGTEEWSCEYRFRRADGRYAIVALSGHVMRDDDGNPLRMVGALNDITRERERERQLAEQAELLNQAQDSIIVSSPDLSITFWNRSATRHYGWSAKEVEGRNKRTLLEVDLEAFDKAVAQLFERGEWSGELRQKRKDGSEFTVESSMALVSDDAGRPKRILCVNTDITERLVLEEQLRQAQRLESVGHLTGGIAHDFNNLLTVILGNAELLMDRVGDDAISRKLATMTRDAATRGADLTHGLLAFARRQPLEPRPVDVNQLISRMQSLLMRALPEDIEIQFVGKPELWAAFVDPAQLESVILNLALNAKDAMPNGGKLVIETDNVTLDEDYSARNPDAAPGRYVLLAISDTGTGIAPDVMEHVFDPFFTTKEQGKGTGLGLSMAYGFARQSGGHIKLYSEAGEGTTAKVYLPRGETKESRVEDKAPKSEQQGGGETVLVVEDDDLVRTHAENQLEAFGYTVLSAAGGAEALDIIEKEKDIDLLFTDVVMSGGMNGPELVEVAKRIRPRLKVLYTSGYTENAIIHQGRLDRGVNLLQKPYQRAELARKVRDVLSTQE